MSDTYGGIVDFPALLTLETDGDPDAALSRRAGFEGLANRTKYLEQLTHAAAGLLKWLPAVGGVDNAGVAQWQPRPGTFPTAPWTQLTPDVFELCFDVDQIPDGCLLQKIDVYIEPKSGHVAVPAVRPRIGLLEIAPIPRTVSEVANNQSPNTLGAYDVPHTVSLAFTAPGLAIAKNSKCYRLMVRGESGANSIAGLMVWGARATFDITNLDAKAG